MSRPLRTCLLLASAAAALALAGCADPGEATISSTADPAAAETPAPTPSAIESTHAGTALPDDCTTVFDDRTREAVEALGFVLDPEWLAASGSTKTGFGDGALSIAVSPALTCSWVSPRGAGDGGIVTSFARVEADQVATVTELSAAFSDRTQHRSAAVGEEVVVGTVWGDNTMPDGYLEAVEALAR